MSRSEGRLLVTTPDGRRVWGSADAAYRGGLAGLTDGATADETAFRGVPPLDRVVAPCPAGADPAATVDASGGGTSTASITRLLFPDQAPGLPDAVHVNGEPMDLAYVVGVLLGNRDLERRLATENAGTASPTRSADRLVAVA
jgi:hypothetical protein